MDNHTALTPKTIKRLIHIAQDTSYASSQLATLTDDESKRSAQTSQQAAMGYEVSSGILDIEAMMEVMEECPIENDFLRASSAFCPGEITGRSTSAESTVNKTMPLGRHTGVINALANDMDKQTNEVKNLLRYSICNSTAYSFHSKKDLTADEASLVMREAPLPVLPNTQAQFTDTINTNSSVVSVGAYFQKRCFGLEQVLGKVPDSPDRSGYSMPSITEVTPKPNYTVDELLDHGLDSIPVRQSRVPARINMQNPTSAKNYDKQTFQSATKQTNLTKNNETYNKSTGFDYSSISKAPEPFVMPINPLASSSFASTRQAVSCKATDVLIRNMHAGLRLNTEETEDSACPTDNSISLSKIADFLGKESNVSVSAMLKYNNRTKPPINKQPLKELHMNLQEGTHEGLKVSNLRDSRKTDAASSSDTVSTVANLRDSRKTENANSTDTLSTVISIDKLNAREVKAVPSIVVTDPANKAQLEGAIKEAKRSKSPSSKSQSTLSTVQENYSSFKSGDSPLQSNKGEVTNTHVLSPNVVYRELDQSVDWHDVLHQKRLKQLSLVEEKWAEIVSNAAIGFVGVDCAVNFAVTTLTDSWLTASFKFEDLPNNGKDITIELPRLPLLLSPGKTEKFTFYITSNVELNATIPYTVCLTDASVEGNIEQYGVFEVHIKTPMIQAMSSDGVNKVTFPPIQEKSSLIKSFVLVSDCSADLQLELSIAESDSVFAIKSVQEILKSDVNKVLMERQGSIEEIQIEKAKTKGMNRQLCRLSSGNAITLRVQMNAPKLSDLQREDNIVSFTGALNVNLIGVNTVLRRVDLIGSVGTVNLVVNVPGNRLHLTSEPTNVTVSNTGTVNGVWILKVAKHSPDNFPFKVGPTKFDIRPGGCKSITLCYTGPEDEQNAATLVFEDLITFHKTAIDISGGSETKTFPIRTNHGLLSFVRPGRKEISLKNSTSKKIHIRVFIEGDGFALDLPGVETKGVYCMPFAPNECRPLPILFNPLSNIPQSGNLHLVYDKNSEVSRSVRLFGCSSGESLRWSGLVTYGDTALVQAVTRAPCRLDLYNKCRMPAFICATVNFNLQYNAVASTARLFGGNCVISGRGRHSLTLHVDWARVERRARDADTAALATICVLTGAELTRRRILKVIRDESNGALDMSLLDDRLKILAGQFEGEDPSLDNYLKDFKETKASLNELIGGLHELTAQIVLPQDMSDENTIVITDDTVVEHHTLCD